MRPKVFGRPKKLQDKSNLTNNPEWERHHEIATLPLPMEIFY